MQGPAGSFVNAGGGQPATGIFYNVMASPFNATGNGTTNDAAAIQAALTAAGNAGGGTVYLPPATYIIGSQLTVPNGVRVLGDNPANTILKATNTFNATSMLTNSLHNGTQEYFFLEKIFFNGNKAGGATMTYCVDLESLFVNSWVKDCIIQNSPGIGLHIGIPSGQGAGCGPLEIRNNWVANSAHENIVVENLDTTGSYGALYNIEFYHNSTEYAAVGYADFRVSGGTGSGFPVFNLGIFGHQTEQPSPLFGAGTYGFYIDGCRQFYCANLFMTANSWVGGDVYTPIQITNNAHNTNIEFKNYVNFSAVQPALVDSLNSVTIGAASNIFYIPQYKTKDSMGAFYFHTNSGVITPPASTSAFTMMGLGVPLLSQTTGVFKVTFDGVIIANGVTISAGTGIQYQLSWGTGGVAPSNAAAATGTVVGLAQRFELSAAATAAGDVWQPFSVTRIINTAVIQGDVWFDLQAEAIGTISDIALANVNMSIAELG